MATYPDDITFTITCTMRERWVAHFLGALTQMERLGKMGSSRDVTVHSDGDGDFRPRFSWNGNLPVPAEPLDYKGGNTFFDAG